MCAAIIVIPSLSFPLNWIKKKGIKIVIVNVLKDTTTKNYMDIKDNFTQLDIYALL